MIKYWCVRDNIEAKESICNICGERTEVQSVIYWCDKCNVPVYEDKCPICGSHLRRLTSDVRPVFPEERLLIEIALGKPFAYIKSSVWNGTGNNYYADGKRINASVKKLMELDDNYVRNEYNRLSVDNTYEYFNEIIAKFIRANEDRYNYITKEAMSYIRDKAAGYDLNEMFVSFSGGKDSTVTSDLVMKALSTPRILHIFGDTTLEFPETMKYVEEFKKEHPKTPLISSRNKDKDFEELCKQIGPPSRVMRWCCTIFKTGAISRRIDILFKNKKRILTFYGIRRSESASRNKYDRDSDSPKIAKQRTVSPIIDWFDFDVWLYMLTAKVNFNNAYRLGYARVGCWCCPNNSDWSGFLSKIHMPEQYFHFRDMLIEFARNIGKKDAEVYIDSGKWKARQGGNGIEYAKTSVVSFAPCALEENAFNYELQKNITEEFFELFKPFGELNYEMGNKRLGEVYVLGHNGNVLLRIQGRVGSNQLKVIIVNHRIAGSRNIKNAEEKIKCQITKYQMCMACLACEAVCRHDAIKISQDKDGRINYRIDNDRCKHCGECVGHFVGGCYMRKVLAIKR